MKPQWMNDEYDEYLEPPTEPRDVLYATLVAVRVYVVCANCGEWIDMDEAYWDKLDTPYCDEYCCEEALEGF